MGPRQFLLSLWVLGTFLHPERADSHFRQSPGAVEVAVPLLHHSVNSEGV